VKGDARKFINSATLASTNVIKKDASQKLQSNFKVSANTAKKGLRVKKTDQGRTTVTYSLGVHPKFFYLWFLENGAKAHPIKARMMKGKRMLANKGSGQGFGVTVAHPGIQPRPFIRPAFDEGKDKAAKKFDDVIWKRIERAWSRT
jgi:hypothetical protein